MATQSVRIGWRPYVNQAVANLLDSYSGAAAAYSLRKLRSSYSGSAIRVRRSSDNTELNIGFDSDGNLDTIALSSFVGSGNGFVTTWYDQSGNNNPLFKNSATNQPRIVNSGVVETIGGKPAVRWITIGGVENLMGLTTGLTNVCSVFLNITYLSGVGMVPLLGHTTAYDYHADGSVYLSTAHASSYVLNGTKYINGVSKTNATFTKSSSNSLISMIHTSASGRVNQISSDRAIGRWFDGYYSEIILYSTDQTTNRVGIESNINTYYSIYPNPTSVWNLLTAAYNADTKSLPSLKTSLFAAYNGESNANDSKGTNNGTPQGGLTYGTGKIGNAFQFNGSNSYVSLPNNSMNLTGDFTVSTWVNFSSFPSASTIISNYYRLPPYSVYYGWSVLMISNQIAFDIFTGVNNSSVRLLSPSIPTNTWKHVTLIHKKNVSLSIYIDGVLSVSTATTFPIGYSGNETPAIGGTLPGDGFQYPTNGKIDAFNVWNKVLTQSEVIELYNSGNGAQYITDSFYKPTTNDALNTYNGTPQGGLTYGLGKVGTAFQFNGSNAYVALPNNIMKFSNTDNFSVSFWIYANVTGYSSVIGNNAYIGGQGTGWGIRTWGTVGGDPSKFTIVFWTNWVTGSGNLLNPLQTDGTTSINTWNHFVITRNSSAQEKIYQNGTLVASQTNSSTKLTYPATSYSNIGVNRYDSTGFEGYAKAGSKIDAMSVWNKELTQTEITELYNSGNGKQYPN